MTNLTNHFRPGNIQDNINTFHGNKIDFFVKLYIHEWPEDAQSNPIHHSVKKSGVGKKNVKRHPKQSDLHGSLNFKKGQVIKTMPPVVHFQPTPHFFWWVKRYVCKTCLNIGLVQIRQEIKFHQYFTNQKNCLFFLLFFLKDLILRCPLLKSLIPVLNDYIPTEDFAIDCWS